MINRFNVRVYFLMLNEKRDAILISDEIIGGNCFTKFPGGGLEYGEGIVDCVHREAMEELNQQVEIIKHFYTTDFLVQSKFKPTDQVISVYYLVEKRGEQQFKTTDKKFDFSQNTQDEESFRWMKISDFHEQHFDFPADRKVAELIRSAGV